MLGHELLDQTLVCFWNPVTKYFTCCRRTGTDLPILSNEATASHWKHLKTC